MKQLQPLLKYIKRYKREVFLALFFDVLLVIFSIASLGLLIPLLDILFSQESNKVLMRPEFTAYGISSIKDYLTDYLNYWMSLGIYNYGKAYVLNMILIGGGILFFLKNLMRYLGTYFMTTLKNGVENNLRTDIHTHMLQLDTAHFTDKRKGDIIARMTADISEIQATILNDINKIVQDPLMIILTIVVLFIFSWKLTLFVLVILPIAGIIISVIGNKLKKPSMKSKIDMGVILDQVEENISSLPIIKSFVVEDKIQRDFKKVSNSYNKNMNKLYYLKNLSSPLSEFLGFVVIGTIIWWGGNLILNHNGLEANVFITYIIMFFQIIGPAKSISSIAYDVKKGQASVERVFEFLNTKPTVVNVPHPIRKSYLEREIAFNNVTFSYGQENVLEDFSLKIKKGETVALVGKSGSGKSTITHLLNRFYDPKAGNITIDNVDIREIKISDLRRMIGYISQDAILFNTSIRENLLIGNPYADDEELLKVLTLAHAYGFVMQKRHRLDEVIGEKGTKLSGGQKQRLVIARALLKNPEFLILDEATSALDSESESRVQMALDTILRGRTAIVIAHRLSTIQDADRIIVLKNGKIVETGKHQELIEMKGEYKSFFDLQNVN